MAIKNRLKSIRHKYEMNQTEFANLLQLPYRQYNRYEKNIEQPSLQNAFKIARLLKLNIEDIFYEA